MPHTSDRIFEIVKDALSAAGVGGEISFQTGQLTSTTWVGAPSQDDIAVSIYVRDPNAPMPHLRCGTDATARKILAAHLSQDWSGVTEVDMISTYCAMGFEGLVRGGGRHRVGMNPDDFMPAVLRDVQRNREL